MRAPSIELAVLMRAANRGDEDAYRQLLQALATRIHGVARRELARMGRTGDEAEDIVQETLLAIHLKRHTWDERKPLDPWVRAIARHKLIDHLRRKGFRDHAIIDDYADRLVDPVAAEATRQVECRDLLSCLTDRQREIIQGISVEGRNARELGQRLGLSEGAVRVALHRALKALAAATRRDQP